MKVVQKTKNNDIGKEIGEAYIELSPDKSVAYLQAIDNRTGEIIRFAKFDKIGKTESVIDLSSLETILNNIISVANSAASAAGSYNSMSSVSITSTKEQKCNYGVSNAFDNVIKK